MNTMLQALSIIFSTPYDKSFQAAKRIYIMRAIALVLIALPILVIYFIVILTNT